MDEKSTTRSYPPNQIIFTQGDKGDFMIVIDSGTVFVEVDGKIITTLGPGEPVGEMALLLPDGLRTATIRADGSVVAKVITLPEFLEMLEAAPPLLQAVIGAFAKRLKETNLK